MTSADHYANLASLSTALAAFVAFLAVFIGTFQFTAAQKSAREVNAVELFLKFNQLSLDHSVSDIPEADFWYSNSKLAVTESLYNITSGIDSWEQTVLWMLNNQTDFIGEGAFATSTYTKKFLSFLKQNGFELQD